MASKNLSYGRLVKKNIQSETSICVLPNPPLVKSGITIGWPPFFRSYGGESMNVNLLCKSVGTFKVDGDI